MTMLSLALPMAQESGANEGIPPELIGLGTFVVLLLLLAVTLLFGKGRPHA